MRRPPRFVALLLSSLAACYGAAPPRPTPVALPQLSSDALLSVFTERRTVIENRKKEHRTCPANVTDLKSEKCTVTYTEVAEPVTHTDTTATYGGQAINHAQFRVITDPQYDAKLVRLDDLRTRCRRANVPRWIGTALVLGGLVTAIAGEFKGPVGLAGGGAFGAGIGAYTIGYYRFGGRDCVEASRIYRDVDLSEEATWKVASGEALATEMKLLADRFNSLRHSTLTKEGSQ